MNTQTNVHAYPDDETAISGTVLESGTPALSIVIGNGPNQQALYLFLQEHSPEQAWSTLDRIIDACRDLKRDLIPERDPAIPQPFGYARPTLVPEPGHTTV